MKSDLPQNGWHVYRVGEFHLNTKECSLSRNEVPLPITPKMFDVLWLLVQNAGHVVGKDELLRTVWSDSFVQESNLAVTIRQLRKILGDDAHNPTYIQTVARRGYRFVAEVNETQTETQTVETPRESRLWIRSKPFTLVTGSALLLSLFALAFISFRGAGTSSAGRTVTRLTNSGRMAIAAISPDGETLVFAQKGPSGESLWKRKITSGEEVQLRPPAAVEYVGLAVPPSSDFAYYSVFSSNSVVSNLSRLSLAGGDAEPLAGIESDVSVSFSPDGKQFAYTEAHSAVNETLLKTSSADGSQTRTLLTLKGDSRAFPVFSANPVAWSPGGDDIACAVKLSDGTDSFFRILLVNSNDGSERYLSERRWGFVDNVVWLDSQNLAITEIESGTMWRRVWIVSTTTDEVRRVTNGLNEYQWLSVARGRLFAIEKSKSSSIYIADFTNGTSSVQTKQIFNEPGSIEAVDWGRSDSVYFNSWSSGGNEVWKINPDGTGAIQLTHNSNLTDGFSVSPVDGTIVFSAAPMRTDNLFIASPDGTSIRQVTTGTDEVRPRFMPDGKTIVFEEGSLIKPTLARVSTDGGEAPRQFTGYYAQHPSVSPDGKIIAYQFMDPSSGEGIWKLALIDSNDGRLVNKVDFPVLITDRQVAWSPAGDLLTMIATSGEGSGFIFLSPVDGSYRLIENVTSDKIASFVWSPDGKRLAFAAQRVNSDVVQLIGS